MTTTNGTNVMNLMALMNDPVKRQQLIQQKLAELDRTNPAEAAKYRSVMQALGVQLGTAPAQQQAPTGAPSSDIATAHAIAALQSAQDSAAQVVELRGLVMQAMAELHNNTTLLRRVLQELGVKVD